MREFLITLAMACLPILGNIVGGLFAEWFRFSSRALSLALHGAVGVVLAVVGVELMPRSLEAEMPWVVVLAFVAGGVFFIIADEAIGIVNSRFGGSGSNVAPWAIYFGVLIDLFSDGVMIGSASTISTGLGFLLALGQVPADVPEGFVIMATFKQIGLSRRTRILLTLSFALPIILGTTIGFWAVEGRPELLKLSLLAFTAGLLTTLVVEEMGPLAHREAEPRMAGLATIVGFALFTLLSIYMG
jgi:ZIP family zinc transporter